MVWNTDSGEQVLDYSGHDGTVFASAGNADGSLVATAGGTRNAIQVWNPATGERKALLQGVGEPVTAVGIDAASGSIAWGNANPCPERVSCPELLGTLDKTLALPTAERFFESPEALGGTGRLCPRRARPTVSGRFTPSPGGKDGLENAVLEIAKWRQGGAQHRERRHQRLRPFGLSR